MQFIERKLWPSTTILPKRFPAVWIKKYVAPVSLNDRLVYVYILRLVYINTHLTTGWYIPYSQLFTWGATFMNVFNLP